ncbi:cell envelope-related function transcriptional attenuator common domain-containing protein [Corynebacterium timonense]|uniref:Cell envelope-related function transcriptional attenuator common domain-containing protein n=1 Tax=Corynebacterium timonense TaxID=441500 RepID=A0A1H1RTJ9_9CORY|nr:cell envelope-related function transcriptional attenuator common domain-containing protein [Corynebacterium timonense]
MRQSGHPALKGVLALGSAVVLVVSGVGHFSVGQLGNSLSASELTLDKGDDTSALDGAVDILLVGSDSRTDAQGNPLSEEELRRLNAGVNEGEVNTDTIMVVRVPEDGSRATAASIPRDTYIHDEQFGNMKINGVYGAYAAAKREELETRGMEPGPSLEQQVARAGQEGLIEAVAGLTGVEVDHYAQVGLYGFALLTDAVGGVDVCLNEPVDDPLSGARFPAGEQTLDGAEALSFVRQRHGLPRGDLDRIVRQQAYMASLVQKILSAGTLTNPSTLRDLAEAAGRSVTLDQGWDVVSFAQQMSGLAGGNVEFTTIPVTSVNGVGDYGESIVTVNVQQVHNFMDSLASPADSADPADPEAPDDSEPGELPAAPALPGAEVYLLNAGETAGLASAVGAHLQEQGAFVASVSNAQPGIYTFSQVVALDPADPAAIELAQLLGGLPITANEGLEPGSLIAVVTDDYYGPRSEEGDFTTNEEETVGTPGEDFGAPETGPVIDAGGDGPRCVN